MTHAGRVHTISGEAEQLAAKILAAVPRDQLLAPSQTRKFIRGLLVPPAAAKPLWHSITFQDTAAERHYLTAVAQRYNNSLHSFADRLLAHGTQSSSSLCQILLDGQLKHCKGWENYGDLSCTDNVQMGGYWDHGWGVFITKGKTLVRCVEQSSSQPFLLVSLQVLDTILLPGPIVPVVQQVFPNHASLLKSYRQFGQELERCL